jgi:hypothetical protein
MMEDKTILGTIEAMGQIVGKEVDFVTSFLQPLPELTGDHTASSDGGVTHNTDFHDDVSLRAGKNTSPFFQIGWTQSNAKGIPRRTLLQ